MLNDSVVNGRVPNNREVLTGTTVHVVPVEGGLWQVVDKLRHIFTFRSKAAALKQAKKIRPAKSFFLMNSPGLFRWHIINCLNIGHCPGTKEIGLVSKPR